MSGWVICVVFLVIGLCKQSLLVFFLLLGVSAGGVGALYHSIQLAQTLPEMRVSTIIDSSWFVNYQSFFTFFVGSGTTSMMNLFNLTQTPLCDYLDESRAAPCCAIASCMVTSLAKSSRSRPDILIIQSGYDTFPLLQFLKKDRQSYNTVSKLTRYMYGFNGYLNGSLEAAIAGDEMGRVSLFQTSCGKHTYISGTSFYDQVEMGGAVTVPLLQGAAKYTQGISGHYWTSVKVSLFVVFFFFEILSDLNQAVPNHLTY